MDRAGEITKGDIKPSPMERLSVLEGELAAAREREGAMVRANALLLEEMRHTRKRYLAIIESFDGHIYICSQDYRIEFMNQRMIERVGRHALGEPCYQVLHQLDAICPWCVNERVYRGERVRWEVQSPKDDRWYYVVNTPIYNEDGTVSKHAMIQDITERKLAEERRRQSEEKFRGIFENAPVAIYQTRVTGEIISVNPMLARLMGYATPAEMLEDTTRSAPSFFVDPEVRRMIVAQALAEHHFVQHEVDYRRRDGSVFVGTLSMRVVRDEAGEVRFLEGFIEDVTLAKRAEEELRKLSETVMQSPVSIIITDCEARIEFVNPKFTQVTGYLPDEVVGRDARTLQSALLQPGDQEMWGALLRGETWEGELLNRKKEGELFWEHVTVSPIRGGCGTITHFVALKQDISEQKRTKEQLLRSQKMEAVGQLAGGIAHDFNNILTAIVGFSSLIQMGLPEDHPLQGHAGQVIAAAARGGSLTQSLLTFSRKQHMNLAVADVNRIVSDLEKFLKRIISEEIDFKTSIGEEVPTVRADSGQLQQVVMNLATNARDAMPTGGVLTIQTGVREVDEEFVRRHDCGTPGRYAVISVSDTGAGIDEETRKRIFEPFFTTKEVGKGTGLGLSIVYGIVEQHQGFIKVVSTPGEGSTFRVFLPAAEPREVGGEVLSAANSATGGSETILVAEDDPVVRELMGEVLGGQGYRVLLTENGTQAVATFSEHREEVKLVLLDMIMPELSGKEAYERIRQVKAGVPVLYFSGYTRDFIEDRGALEEGTELLMKPVEPLALLRKVREMLDGAIVMAGHQTTLRRE